MPNIVIPKRCTYLNDIGNIGETLYVLDNSTHKTIMESNNGAVILDHTTRILAAINPFPEIMGMPREELIGRYMIDFIHPAYKPIARYNNIRRQLGMSDAANNYGLVFRNRAGDNICAEVEAQAFICGDEMRTAVALVKIISPMELDALNSRAVKGWPTVMNDYVSMEMNTKLGGERDEKDYVSGGDTDTDGRNGDIRRVCKGILQGHKP